jgi:hypothetical protein
MDMMINNEKFTQTSTYLSATTDMKYKIGRVSSYFKQRHPYDLQISVSIFPHWPIIKTLFFSKMVHFIRLN